MRLAIIRKLNRRPIPYVGYEFLFEKFFYVSSYGPIRVYVVRYVVKPIGLIYHVDHVVNIKKRLAAPEVDHNLLAYLLCILTEPNNVLYYQVLKLAILLYLILKPTV